MLKQLATAMVVTGLMGSLLAQSTLHEPDSDGIIPQPHLALTNTHVLNVRTGEILSNATVVVRDGMIVSVGTRAPAEGVEALDLEGKYLLPGFMDGHWHGRSLENARRALESGVTTMKSANVGSYSDITMRELVKKGYLAGPDILAVGVYVRPNLRELALADPRLYRFIYQEVKGVENVREVVRINLDHGVDWIKTRSGGSTANPAGPDPRMATYTVQELAAIVEEAATKGIGVACHAHGEEVITNAVRAGCKTVEHGSYMDETVLALMKERGTVWVPTYTSVLEFQTPYGDYNSSMGLIRGPYILHNLKQMIRKGHQMGIPIITGTDTRYGPRSSTRISREITNFVEIGMTPLEAIQAATTVSAQVYGLQQRTGAIEAGLEADLVAFKRNPLEDIMVVQDPLFVMSNGRLVFHRTVDPEKQIAPQVEGTGFGAGGPLP